MIRGIAIIMVFFVHYGQMFGNPVMTQFGQMGCQIFFFVSGYTCSISLQRTKTHLAFYKRRFYSIAPGFYTLLILNVLLNVFCDLIFHKTLIGGNYGFVSILCNIFLLHGLLPFCNNNVAPGGWYIGTIVILYLIHPYVEKLYRKSNGYWMLTAAFSTIGFAIPIIYSLALHGTPNIKNNSFLYYLFLNQMGCYLLGISLYHAQKDEKSKITKLNKNTWLVLSCISLAVTVFCFYCGLPLSFSIDPFLMALFGLCFFEFLSFVEWRIKSNIYSLVQWMGKNSIYIYLTHLFIIKTISYGICKILTIFGITYNWSKFTISLIPSILLVMLASIVLKKLVRYEKKILKCLA